VTIALVALNVLMFLKLGVFENAPSIRSACLQPSKILGRQKEVSRIWYSLITHADEYHLYYNMASLIVKGSQLEPMYGSLGFLILILELGFTSNVLYLGLANLLRSSRRGGGSVLHLYSTIIDPNLWNTCAVGFSGILFALKVILTHDKPGSSDVGGYRVPTRLVAWFELVLIQLVTPNASFTGHLCGIVSGLLHVYFFRYLFMYTVGRRSRQRRQRAYR
jgi:rhomboid domain-containing protein 1